MQVSDIMTYDVVSVLPNDMVLDVAKKMAQYNIGVVPVCENNVLLGVITDRDITLRLVANELSASNVKACDIMSSSAVSISPSSSIEAASNIMANAQYRRLMVTEAGKVVGIVSIGDLAKIRGFYTETAKALSEISSDK